MSKASQFVDALLETDEPADVNIPPEDVNPERFISHHADELEREAREGKVTPNTAMTANTFYHRTVKYADSRTAYQARRNGATKTWRTRPNEFRIPIKIGFRGYGYIDNRNANEWSVTPIPTLPKPPRQKPVRPPKPPKAAPVKPEGRQMVFNWRYMKKKPTAEGLVNSLIL